MDLISIGKCNLYHKECQPDRPGNLVIMSHAYVEVWLVMLTGHELQRPMSRVLVSALPRACVPGLCPDANISTNFECMRQPW